MRFFFIMCLLAVSMESLAQENIGAKIDALLKPYDNPETPGLSVGIVKDGAFIYNKSFGLANLEYGVKNSDSTVFSIASIAKQFTAACVWALIRENRLSLDDDIRQYLPELPHYGHTIKIRHLLNHTSGLRNYHTLMNLSGFDYDRDYYDNQTVLELACKQLSTSNIPGEKVLYGNTPYNLLAVIIERISGKNLHEYANEKIFNPLAMHHTLVRTENNSLIKNRSVGYVRNGESFSQYPKIQCSYGAGSMGSTIRDLAKWTNIFNGLNPGYHDLANFLSAVEKLPSGEKAEYGRGVMVDEYKNYKTIHHSGYGLGSQSQLISVPDLKLSVIFLTNLDEINPTPLSYKILDLFIPETAVKKNSRVKTFKANPKDFASFVGQYKEIASDMKMEIFIENDTLKSKGSQAKKAVPLVSYAKNRFYRINNESVKYEFADAKISGYDMMISFGGTPFYFNRAVFVKPESVDTNEFTGSYFSAELDVEYYFSTDENGLFLSYQNHKKMPLTPGQEDEFGNGDRVLYHFTRNEKNQINGILVSSDGSVSNIRFAKK